MDSGFSRKWHCFDLPPPSQQLWLEEYSSARQIFCNFTSIPVFYFKQTMKNELSNESLWRRNLTAAERAAIGSQPEMEIEARLTELLAKIPDTSVPSNFTARLLAAVEMEDARATRPRDWTLNWRLLWPRVAAVAAVLFFAGVGIQRYETSAHRAELAKNVVLLAAAQPPPSMEVLENLDAIQRMGQSGHADGELLAMLQ